MPRESALVIGRSVWVRNHSKPVHRARFGSQKRANLLPGRAPQRCDGCAETSNDSRCCIACSQPTTDTVGSISVEKRWRCGPIATAHVHCVVQVKAHFMSRTCTSTQYTLGARQTASSPAHRPVATTLGSGCGQQARGTRHGCSTLACSQQKRLEADKRHRSACVDADLGAPARAARSMHALTRSALYAGGSEHK